MPLFSMILTLLVVGVLLWLLNTKATVVDGTIKQIINVVVVVVVVIWLLQATGLWDALTAVQIHR